MSAPEWSYQISLWNCGTSPDDPNDFVVGVSVYFPPLDLSVILERMKRHNKAVKPCRR
jgi:hypothetical protein